MEQSGNMFDLQLDQQSVIYLSETARWTRLLSIIGFIYCGLLVIAGLFMGSIMARMMTEMSGDGAMPAMNGGFLGFFFLLGALILFFPAYYLFSFSSKMRRALRNNEQAVLTESFKNLKSFFKFYGILVIIVLSVYSLALIAAIVGAMLGTHRP
jgi:heme/copper-type cytochrome/quinol oxidase subunit 2